MMKNRTIISVVTVAVLICTAARSQPDTKAPDPETGAAKQERALFLHLLAPRAYTDPAIPAHRILTTRVYPFHDFSITVGDSENVFAKPWEGAITHPLWNKNGSPEQRPLAPLRNTGNATLSGWLEESDGKFMAHLQGLNRTTLNYFTGPIELEKPVSEQGSYYHGGSIWGVWFALSTNADCSAFLKALEDGSLKRPNVVDRNSPLARQWVGGKPSAEPDVAPNGSQSIPSETNSTLPAVGSRR